MSVGPSLFKTGTQAASAVCPRTSKRRVLIVDDHPIVRQGLRRLIEAEAGSGSVRRGRDGARSEIA